MVAVKLVARCRHLSYAAVPASQGIFSLRVWPRVGPRPPRSAVLFLVGPHRAQLTGYGAEHRLDAGCCPGSRYPPAITHFFGFRDLGSIVYSFLKHFFSWSKSAACAAL